MSKGADHYLEKLVLYCLSAGPPWCYEGWSPQLLKDYLAFHALNKTMKWIQVGGEVRGCGVMWQCHEKDLHLAEVAGRHLFNWEPSDPSGDALFLGDFITSAPGAMACLVAEFEKCFPAWATLNWFTYRRGKLQRLNGTRYEKRFRPTANTTLKG